MADLYAPQNPGLAAFIQPYLSWRERQANESRIADLMLPKAIPDYLAGLAYGTNPREAPLTSWRSTMAYGLPAVEALGITPALRPVARGGLAAYGALERRLIPPAGQLNIFAGPGAKTADLAALATAKQLEAGGVIPQEIWKQTGWFKGPEGKWKFEIPDSGADIKVEHLVKDRNTGGLAANFIDQFSDVMSHPGYFMAYPGETQNPVISKLKINKGLPEYGALHTKLEYPAIGVTAPTVESAKSQLLHELQHLIQKNEGFARGGSPANSTQQAYDDYLRLGGEAEARAVQARMNMTPQQRGEVFPLESYDVPQDQLIIRQQGGGVAASAMPPPEFLNQADPAVRAMITDQLKLQGLRDVQITDGVIRDEIARRNAVTMMGLPAENTAADRAAALGFKTPGYHATYSDVSAFDNARLGGSSAGGKETGVSYAGTYASLEPTGTSAYLTGWDSSPSLEDISGANIMPLIIRSKKPKIIKSTYSPGDEIDFRYEDMPPQDAVYKLAKQIKKDWKISDYEWSNYSDRDKKKFVDYYVEGLKEKGNDSLLLKGSWDFPAAQESRFSNELYPSAPANQIVAFDPNQIRSRFAAFDPARAKEADILAGIAGLSLIPALTLQDYFRQGQ